MKTGQRIIKKAQEVAKQKWDHGDFDNEFRLKKNPRISMEGIEARVEVEIGSDGDIYGVVHVPAPCGCCEDDVSYFALDFE